MFSKKFYIIIFLFYLCSFGKSQAITNGNFSGGTTGWACGAEVSNESVYGGPTSNAVAEVDAGAGLCQTLNGLTIGSTYTISFQASRRTGGCPSPPTTNVIFSVSGGVLSTVVTRTNTTFGYTTSTYLFTANAPSHTIDFAPGSGFGSSTCGMIIDNVVLTFSPLPIELLSFTGNYLNGIIEFKWQTASEKNNAFFEIEKSVDGLVYEKAAVIPSQAKDGNSSLKLKYQYGLKEIPNGVNYYRLKQTDYDQQFSYSPVIAIASETKQKSLLFPNPNSGNFSINTSLRGTVKLILTSITGEQVFYMVQNLNNDSGILEVKTEGLKSGFYYCTLSNSLHQQHFQLTIE